MSKPERLYQQDVILLEKELMPLMLKQDFYENKLTALQIQTTITREGRSLWELIHNADSVGGGQRVNDSYVRLRDTELLDESAQGWICHQFQNERFMNSSEDADCIRQQRVCKGI